MISEKTVELNVTAELLSWLSYISGATHVALGPSQRAEGYYGYDASLHGGGTPVAMIQYKRAYVDGLVWSWRLNRTTHKDQHRRLQLLEDHGYPVVYAFPHFATLRDLVIKRRQLLVNTFWCPPSFIQPAGGPYGHHEVYYDKNSGDWSVKSRERRPMRHPLGVHIVADWSTRANLERRSLREFVSGLNEIMTGIEEDINQERDALEPAGDEIHGHSILIREDG